jgi:hypoxanthine-guanine phosphoribosyltransferase
VQVSFDAEAVAGRHCIMVDDLCDSGLTLLTVRDGSGCRDLTAAAAAAGGSTAHSSVTQHARSGMIWR